MGAAGAGARALAGEIGVPGIEVLARREPALLPDGDPAEALAAFARSEKRLDALLANASADDRDTMCRNVRINREILAAWREESGDDEPRGNESVTRVG